MNTVVCSCGLHHWDGKRLTFVGFQEIDGHNVARLATCRLCLTTIVVDVIPVGDVEEDWFAPAGTRAGG